MLEQQVQFHIQSRSQNRQNGTYLRMVKDEIRHDDQLKPSIVAVNARLLLHLENRV